MIYIKWTLLFFLVLPSHWIQANTLHYVLIQEGTLNVRDKGDINGKVLFKLKRGDKVYTEQESVGSDEWTAIKTSDKRSGYVLGRYLGTETPDELDKAAILAMPGGDMGDAVLKPLGIRTSGKWFLSLPEYLYVATRMQKKGIPFVLFGPENKTGSFVIKGFKKYGCQEQELPSGELKGEAGAAAQNWDNFIFAASGLSAASQVELKKIASNEAEETILREKAYALLLNKGFKGKISELVTDGVVSISIPHKKEGASLFYSARYRINIMKENIPTEKYYAYLMLNGKKEVVYARSEELMDEVGMYGGPHHLVGAVYEKDSSSLILIFYHVGYDGGVYQLFEIKNGKLIELNYGYGDAC